MHREDFEVLLRSRVPLIVVESRDEAQVLKALTRACSHQSNMVPVPAGTRGSTAVPCFQ